METGFRGHIDISILGYYYKLRALVKCATIGSCRARDMDAVGHSTSVRVSEF
jgi:hypothetical protein